MRTKSQQTRDRAGDGPLCAEPGDHGPTYVMSTGRLWCPVTQALFGKATYDDSIKAFVPGALVRAGALVVDPIIAPTQEDWTALRAELGYTNTEEPEDD